MPEVSELLDEATRVWAKAQVVYESPSWNGEPAARALVERIAAVPECHEGLLGLLSSPNQLVVAYALEALNLMDSSALAQLPDELLERRQQITLVMGSFKNSMGLGGLARQYRKRARRQH